MLYLQNRFVLDKLNINPKVVKILPKWDAKKWKELIKSIQPLIEKLRLDPNRNILLSKADEILEHKFNLLGKNYFSQDLSGDNNSTYKQINWHYDPSSGYTFPNDVWYRFVIKRVPDWVDIKYPWELSRCQHFILLGEAYTLIKDEKYALEYRSQILDWIENNPVRYGINWSNTMEVGIRVANWTLALLYFIKSSHITENFLSKYFQSVLQHGYHIYHNLENLQPATSNHYIGDLFGLYILSSVYPFLDQSQKWLKFSKKELEKEIIRQTDEDGWDYESSTAYHRLVTEMFIYIYIIADYLNQPFSDSYINRLNKMLGVLNIIQKSDNTIPQIGDNDSGCSLVFYFDNDNLNVNSLTRLAHRNNLITPKKTSGFLKHENRGLYIYKNDDIYFLITAGPKKLIGLGSHAHNDILSFVLNINGEDILVDPGTYIYMSDTVKRNHFRSIASHNTLYWDGIEPRNLTDGLFKMVETGTIDVKTATGNRAGFKFVVNYGYKNRYHQRSICYDQKDDYIIVTDTASHESAILNFTCGPKYPPREIENGFTVNTVKFVFNDKYKLVVQDSFYSSGYGKIQPTKSVNVFLSGTEITYKMFFR